MGCRLSTSDPELRLSFSEPAYAVMEICRRHIREEERDEAFDYDGWYLLYLSPVVMKRAEETTPLVYEEMSLEFRGRYTQDEFVLARMFISGVAAAGDGIHCSH